MKKTFSRAAALLLAVMMLCALIPCAFAEEQSVIDTILGAGTTQAFSEEAVPEEDIEAILSAGLSAESAINQQPWFFVAVTNKSVMEQVSSAGGSFTPPAGAAPAGAPGGDAPSFPAGAPAGGSSAKAGLGDSSLAVIVYKDENTSSPDASFDCGLAVQNIYLAAASLGYGVKIISSPTRSLNGEGHDSLCTLLGVDPSLQAVAVVLIGRPAEDIDLSTGASVRKSLSEKASIVK